MQVRAYASTAGEASDQVSDVLWMVDNGQGLIAGPLVIAQHTRQLYFVVADQITWQVELCGAGEWVPRELVML